MTPSQQQDILRLLRENARLSVADLATMTGVSPEKVSQLITQWESNGTILKYITVFNEQKHVESTKIRALIEVSIRPEKKKGYDSIASRICKHPNVIDHYLISGNFDFLVIVEGDSLQEISSFVSDKLASIENVRSIGTHFILKKYKENGVLFEQEELADRLAVMP